MNSKNYKVGIERISNELIDESMLWISYRRYGQRRRILPLNQKEGCFLPRTLLVLQLAEHLGAVPHDAMTL